MRADAILDLVRRLLTVEAEENGDQTSLSYAAERVSDKMRMHLSKRIGQEGFRTLLARALALTKSRFPSLRVVRVEENGSLVGLRGAAESSEAAVALLACLVGLLVTFIGEDLTLRMLDAVWPEAGVSGAADGGSERL